jgi:hypothetical protein
MPTAILIGGAVVAAIDAALRAWRPPRGRAVENLLFLAIAWVPFFALPHVGAHAVLAAAAAIGLVAMVDFSRMVGLSAEGRFFVPALALTALCFPLAAVRHGALLASVPVLSLLAIAVAGATAREPHAFLQKLCLAWLAVLAYGLLYAHAVLFTHAVWPTATANQMLALVILVAKLATVAWLAARRASGRKRIQLLAAPLGGAAGGALVVALWPGLAIAHHPRIGRVLGLALGAGSRAHTLIVADVTSEPERQRKGTMLFGFGLSLALGYWLLWLVLAPGWK